MVAALHHLQDSACDSGWFGAIAAEGRIPAPTLVANMENVTLNLESVSVSPMVCRRLLNSNSWLSELLLWVRILFPSPRESFHPHSNDRRGVVTTQPENVSAFRPGQVWIVLNVACPVLWIVLVIETPLRSLFEM